MTHPYLIFAGLYVLALVFVCRFVHVCTRFDTDDTEQVDPAREDPL